MPIHDTGYQHWDGAHLGVWSRRLVIAQNGVMRCLQVRGMRHVVSITWMSALAMSAILFFVGQLLVPDGIIVRWLENLNPQLQMFARLLTGWLEQNPDTSVRVTQNVLFYYFCTLLMPVNIFALGMIMPLLITRDLASNAIIVYSSKAVSRTDYFLGKFATAFGLMTLTWLGPVLAAWFLGNLLAPDWWFFWHSRAVLGHALSYVVASMVILSLLALGVSGVSSKEKSTPALWFMWWIVGGVVRPIARQTEPWLQHVSFSFNLKQLATASFRIGDDIRAAQENIPVLGDMLRGIRSRTLAELNSPYLFQALVGLGLMVLVAIVILNRRVKPE
jgi:ABC-2 type transport system permease protein